MTKRWKALREHRLEVAYDTPLDANLLDATIGDMLLRMFPEADLSAPETCSLLTSIWDPFMWNCQLVPPAFWFNYELVAPLLSLMYDAPMVLYSCDQFDNFVTTSYFPTGASDRVGAVTMEMANGISFRDASTPHAVVLVLWQEHYYAIKPRNSRSLLSVREPVKLSSLPSDSASVFHYFEDIDGSGKERLENV